MNADGDGYEKSVFICVFPCTIPTVLHAKEN
jgi:hypothetical protein